MADLSEPIIGLEPPARGSNGTVELTTADENNGEVPDVPPSESQFSKCNVVASFTAVIELELRRLPQS